MSKSTKAQLRAAKKYADKVDHISISVPKGTKDKLKGIGEEQTTQYIHRLIEKDLKSRHRDVVAAAKDRTLKEMEQCKTVEDWHRAFSKLLSDFRNEVEGEMAFEAYIVEVLGQEALDKFLKNVTVPAFDEDTIRHMEAVDDFFVDEQTAQGMKFSEEVTAKYGDIVDKWSSPEFLAQEDYKYLAHLYSTSVLRCEQMEASITNLLGQEAFDRLVAQGSYDIDHLYYAAMASTHNKARQHKYFIDWLTRRGIFAPDEEQEEKNLKDFGWESPATPPKEATAVKILLADGASRIAIYMPPKGNKKAAWLSGQRDYSQLLIGWQAIEGEKPEKVTKKKEIDPNVSYAYNVYAEENKNIDKTQPNWRRKVQAEVSQSVVDSVLSENKTVFSLKKEDLSMVSETFQMIRRIVDVMGQTGFCRKQQIWRIAWATTDIDLRGKKETDFCNEIFDQCQESGIMKSYNEGTLYALTSKGVILYDAIVGEGQQKFTRSIILAEHDNLDATEMVRQSGVISVERVFENAGYNISFDHERDIDGQEPSMADLYLDKNGEEICVQVFNKLTPLWGVKELNEFFRKNPKTPLYFIGFDIEGTIRQEFDKKIASVATNAWKVKYISFSELKTLLYQHREPPTTGKGMQFWRLPNTVKKNGGR